MVLQKNISLRDHTTFKTGGRARFFVSAQSIEEAKDALAFVRKQKLPLLILGGGSNMLLLDNDFPGLALKIMWRGIVPSPYKGGTLLSTAAGENWDEVVSFAVEQGLYGIENLSGIPGNVGAAPIQNIGAYGTELEQVLHKVEAIDLHSRKAITFTKKECRFTYRDSRFKREPGRFLITAVHLLLANSGELNLSYNDLSRYFRERPYAHPTLSSVRKAVLEIRAKKLPDPKVLGTAGSFFKHPIVSSDVYETLFAEFGDLPATATRDGQFKLSAGWLIEHVAKLKGVRVGRAGVHEHHALVLVNYGGAKAEQILSLAERIQREVKNHTNISLEFEVNVR